jgi:hypothetical protein
MKKRVPIVPPELLRIAARMPKPPPSFEGIMKVAQQFAKFSGQFSGFHNLGTIEVEVEDEGKDASTSKPATADSPPPAPPKARSSNKGRPTGTAKTLTAVQATIVALKIDKPTMADLDRINDHLAKNTPHGVKSASRTSLRTALIALAKKLEG